MKTGMERVEEEETHIVNSMEIVLGIVEEGKPQLVNTVEIVEETIEEEETLLVNAVETVGEKVEQEEIQLVNTVETVTVIVEDEETHLVNTLKSTLQTLPPLPTECCIYRVPYELRCVNEKAYTPMLVSIGPFHHGKESLQDMEVHKQRYLNDFLKRTPDLDLEYYVRSLKELEDRARNCYSESIPYSSNDFVKMMLLDGCFIVEFCLKYWHSRLRNKDDPIFKSRLMILGIKRDMALLENQLPFFILEHLFNLIVESDVRWGNSFLEIAINTMDSFMSTSEDWIFLGATTYQAKHMVDLCLQYYTPTGTKCSPKTEGGLFPIPNATRLHKSGVTFTKRTGSSVECLLDVKFTNGNLEIPTLQIEDSTEDFLRNLIAYEQCDSRSDTQFFSDYMHLIDCLIDTPNDVELLRKVGIMDSIMGDNEQVSQMFNKLDSGVICRRSFYFRRLFEDVNDYCTRPWHAWRAKLKRDYFNAPWRPMSVVAAVILIIVGFIQSVKSILN